MVTYMCKVVPARFIMYRLRIIGTAAPPSQRAVLHFHNLSLHGASGALRVDVLVYIMPSAGSEFVCVIFCLFWRLSALMVHPQDGFSFSYPIASVPLRAAILPTQPSLELFQWPSSFSPPVDDAFHGGVFDGRFVWCVPWSIAQLVRIDTTSPTGAVKVFDANWPVGFHLPPKAFDAAVFDGRSLWLLPGCADSIIRVMMSSDSESVSMTRFDSWPTEVAVTSGTESFDGASFDGRYIWLVPLLSTCVVRLDTSLATAGQMRAFCDWPSDFTIGIYAFVGALFDGSYLWLVPHYADAVVRFDTNLGSQGRMTAYRQWPADFVKSDSAFAGGTFDGRYVWLVPWNADSVVRVDTSTSHGSIGAMKSFQSWPNGFSMPYNAFHGAMFDGRYVWLVPHSADSMLRIDTHEAHYGEMTRINHWPNGFQKQSSSFFGSAFDGHCFWLIPRAGAKIVQIRSVYHVSQSHSEQVWSTTATMHHGPSPPLPSLAAVMRTSSSVAVGAVYVLLVSAPSGTIAALQRAVLQSQLQSCESAVDSPLDVLSSPTQMRFGSTDGQFLRGAVVGNVILLVGYGCGFVLLRLRILIFRRNILGAGNPRGRSVWTETSDRLAVALQGPFLFLLQPLLSSSLACVTALGGNELDLLIGVCGCLLVAGDGCWVVTALRNLGIDPRCTCRYRHRRRRSLRIDESSSLWNRASRWSSGVLWLFDNECRCGLPHPSKRHRLPLVDAYVPSRYGFLGVEFVVAAAGGLIGGLQPAFASSFDSCRSLLAAQTALNGCYLLAILFRPFRRRWDFICGLMISVLGVIWGFASLNEKYVLADDMSNVQMWVSATALLPDVAISLYGATVTACRCIQRSLCAGGGGDERTDLHRETSDSGDHIERKRMGSVKTPKIVPDHISSFFNHLEHMHHSSSTEQPHQPPVESLQALQAIITMITDLSSCRQRAESPL